ncbi:MAG: helix-turn-helix domain-containing protein [Methylobacter sp.]|nr:helix-turn-helix domain-containing protein [Candidatus Methylobacter titanis]
MSKEVHALKDTAWLAQRLGLSVSTIERLRSKGSSTLPPHLMIGNSIRYDERVVEQFLENAQSKSKCEVCDD